MNDNESQITHPNVQGHNSSNPQNNMIPTIQTQPTYTIEPYNTLPQTFVRPQLSIEDRIAKIENDIADIKQALDMIKWRI